MKISGQYRKSAILILKGFLVLCAAVVVFSLPASADTFTYSYTGLPFTSFTGYSCPPTCSITGTFTLAQQLGPSSAEAQVSPVSFSFSDGVTTFSDANVTGNNIFSFSVGTDSDGNVNSWAIMLTTDNSNGGSILYTCNDAGCGVVDGTENGASVASNDPPGDWTFRDNDDNNGNSVPEPGVATQLLAGVAILGLAVLVQRAK